ncbi:MAG: hypothetical protein PHE03_08420, partial [Bacteroidales bacterium]|nr:hypothetical protein [Bacteroidales bacterium]
GRQACLPKVGRSLRGNLLLRINIASPKQIALTESTLSRNDGILLSSLQNSLTSLRAFFCEATCQSPHLVTRIIYDSEALLTRNERLLRSKGRSLPTGRQARNDGFLLSSLPARQKRVSDKWRVSRYTKTNRYSVNYLKNISTFIFLINKHEYHGKQHNQTKPRVG